MSENSTGKIVRYVVDPDKPYQPSAEEVARLAAIKDEDIDLSDIPEQTGIKGWSRPGLRSRTSAHVLILDSEIVDFFGDGGEQASRRMNAVLREYVEAQRRRA